MSNVYRAGQRIRIEWEGFVKEGRGFAGSEPVPCVDVPEFGRVFLSEGKHLNITILSEPRPDEPKGLGAVVTAPLIHGGRPWTFIRTHLDKPWMADDGGTFGWHLLVDPVVVQHEGWTP